MRRRWPSEFASWNGCERDLVQSRIVHHRDTEVTEKNIRELKRQKARRIYTLSDWLVLHIDNLAWLHFLRALCASVVKSDALSDVRNWTVRGADFAGARC